VKPRVAIIDYGMGNLFSIRQACEKAGFEPFLTVSSREVLAADGVVLPGVGAFGEAMETLQSLGLVPVLRKVASSGKPLLGICLGMQLLMSESEEFGKHEGLSIVRGRVVRFESPVGSSGEPLKVPHVGWNRIHRAIRRSDSSGSSCDSWIGSPLEGLLDGEYMYFVHSYYVQPENFDVVLSKSRYGQVKFCSSLQSENTFGCQFHPERSGPQGLKIYHNLAGMIGFHLKDRGASVSR